MGGILAQLSSGFNNDTYQCLASPSCPFVLGPDEVAVVLCRRFRQQHYDAEAPYLD